MPGDSDIDDGEDILARERRDTSPDDVIVAPSKWWDNFRKLSRREDDMGPISNHGNAGWYFGNVGALTLNVDGVTLRTKEATELRSFTKNNPAQIMGLCQCDMHLEKYLYTAVAVEDQHEPSVAGDRASYDYLSLRGRERASLLLGVRLNTGLRIEKTNWDRLCHGRYRTKLAYTRGLVAKVHTHEDIGRIGNQHTVGVIHVHRHLAKDRFSGELETFWDWLEERCRACDVIMGDFSLQLLAVIPTLRSRGVKIDLAAWFPWKAVDGTPCADTCAIFFVNRPGVYQLTKGLADLHSHDATGILWARPAAGEAAVAAGEGNKSFEVFPDNGPGFPLRDFKGLLKETLTPSTDAHTIESMRQRKILFKVKEKRLSLSHYVEPPHEQKTGHYPLCVFTQNPSLRSAAKHAARQQRVANRQGWWKPRGDDSWQGTSRGYW